jgi:hypothetical protein
VAGTLPPAPPTSPPAPVIAEIAAPPPTATGDVLDLIWFEPAFVPRLCAWWKELCAEVDREDPDPRAADPEEARRRHHVLGILSGAAALDPGAVPRLAAEAVDAKGRFLPPLALVGGDLRFLFDGAEERDAHAEHQLLFERRYAVRKVLGGDFIRAQLAADPPIPVYLPGDLDRTLPMAAGMRARLVVAVHLQQDPREASPFALRAVALARLFPRDALRG